MAKRSPTRTRVIPRSRRRRPLTQPGAIYCHCGKPAYAQRYDDGLALCPDCRARRAQEVPADD